MTLMERERELRRIDELLASARAGEGATLLIEGTAGIGKTALLAAAGERAAGQGVTSLTARGGELERDLAFAVVRQLFEARLRNEPAEVRNELLSGAAELAAPVFGMAPASADAGVVGAVVHGLYWLCSNLADRGPLLLAIDDAHWCDDASLRFVSHLARRVTELPVLLVLATRPALPGRTDPVGRALSGVSPEVVRLGPLSERAVGALVRQALAADVEDEFCRACARATAGNPFLLSEALIGLRADGVRPTAAEAHRIDALRPETLTRAVLTRLARLGPDAVRLARCVAVLGPAAELRRIAALANLGLGQAADLVDALAHDGLVTAGSPIEFAHPLVRGAVYGDTAEALRAVAHKQAARMLAADAMPSEQLVPHLLAAAPDGDPWVVAELRAATADALARGAPELAAACLERALAEPAEPVLRAELLTRLGGALGMLNRTAEAADALRAALDLTSDPDRRIEITMDLGRLMVMTGQGHQALELFEGARRSSAARPGGVPRRILVNVAWGRLTALEPPLDWMRQLDSVAPQLRGGNDDDRMALSLLAFGGAATGDRPSAKVARLAALAGDGPLPPEPWILINLASAALAVADHLPPALDLLDRGLATARRLGDITAFAYLSVLRSHTAHYAGRLLDAEADAWAALSLAKAESQDAPLAAAVLVDALIDRGDLPGAQRILTEQGIDGDQPLSMLIAHFIHTARGRLRLGQNRHRDALADLLPCGEGLVAAGCVNPGFAAWRCPAALAHLALGETSAAQKLVDEELALARAFGAPRAISAALRTAAQIEGGQASIELLQEAVTLLDGSPAQLEHAQALVYYGSAVRRTGRRADAQEPLRRGLDLATRCGARALAQRANDELVAAGARPRRAALSGPAALTASELRVARMAAAGSSNREIAQALFVARRTVEVHLTSTYRKLGITSRQALRDAIDHATDPPTDARD
ncbi:ATP-binding protein [Streptomyces sp. NPDC056479]|uniref:ATP-binding protein n=1 Tax=Streptomyces sp. NPDC056479 TaxID=3345832 RepID=UPI0036A0F015